MRRFALGWKALFRVWTNHAFASQVGRWLEASQAAGASPAAAPSPAPARQAAEPVRLHPRTGHTTTLSISRSSTGNAAGPSGRHDAALSLLAVLQRDARLLDFLKESTEGYSDAEVGAATRSVHKEAAAVIERLFGVAPMSPEAEGASVEVPAGYDPARYRLLGNVPKGAGPWRGTLVHPGWKAVRADVPAWTGRHDAANVLAPTEVQF